MIVNYRKSESEFWPLKSTRLLGKKKKKSKYQTILFGCSETRLTLAAVEEQY